MGSQGAAGCGSAGGSTAGSGTGRKATPPATSGCPLAAARRLIGRVTALPHGFPAATPAGALTWTAVDKGARGMVLTKVTASKQFEHRYPKSALVCVGGLVLLVQNHEYTQLGMDGEPNRQVCEPFGRVGRLVAVVPSGVPSLPLAAVMAVPVATASDEPGVPQLGASGTAWRLLYVEQAAVDHLDGGTEFKRTLVPLAPAYGMTVQRSQGMDLDAAVVVAHTFAMAGNEWNRHSTLLYVALSRCKRRSMMHIVWTPPGSNEGNTPCRELVDQKPIAEAVAYYRRLNGVAGAAPPAAAPGLLAAALMEENAKLERAGANVRLVAPEGAVNIGQLQYVAAAAAKRPRAAGQALAEADASA
jgi:hypothetical protein